MRRTALLTTVFTAMLAAGSLPLSAPAQAQSNDEAKIEARVGA